MHPDKKVVHRRPPLADAKRNFAVAGKCYVVRCAVGENKRVHEKGLSRTDGRLHSDLAARNPSSERLGML
jgi:hypothetical protein